MWPTGSGPRNETITAQTSLGCGDDTWSKHDALVEYVVNVLLEKYVDGTDMEFFLNVEEEVNWW